MGIIITEAGLHFAKDGDRWVCVEWPRLAILRGGGYEVEGQRFNSLAGPVGLGEPAAHTQYMPDAERARIAVTEEQYRAARAAARDGLPQLDL